MYYIIDSDYRIFISEILTGEIRARLRKGQLSVICDGKGLNIDGFEWTELPVYKKENRSGS